MRCEFSAALTAPACRTIAKERRVARPFAAVLAAALLLAACGPEAERPLQGYVEGEYVRIAAPFGGTLQQLAVRRGDDVAIGAPVFALERDNEVAARRQAEQQLQSAQARLENLKTGRRPTEVATVAEQLRQALAARELAAANLKRVQQLHASGFLSSAALDDARTQLQRDEAQVASLQASVATARLPARADEIRAAEADARAAREVLAQADWRLAQRAIPAPAAGRVHDTYYAVGDWVPAGSPVASVLPPAGVKLRFFVPETSLGRLQRGQKVGVVCDGCPAPVAATIDFIADRAEFTPPVLYSRDNRAKLVYRVEARPEPAAAARLHPGQPVDVTLPAAR
ncbi:MAG: HlyD family efflux transporter periplasmic adaptor subunit [Betaproteobacteria bacterium]|jgi:HlyD family secretion protein|nr:HlyD family efflux transporter periplasmic adaptor subunit [Betaproteobacteria bacterium]MBK6603571.1 HlyD family efflux transporter periplasmic adaptor subunit [Betaproteobacteria bacterium]MBK7081608.1 HlyD family efflux transporter periplasmic adaptor subunit [Betaproteobacteria bacterium]